jgi:hypothetical protein
MPVSAESYCPEHPKWFSKLIAQEVEIAYASIWFDNSHAHYGAPLGLPEFDYLPFHEYGPYKLNSTKAAAITALYGNRPVALFDDGISKETLVWAKQRIEQGAPTFLCKPDKLFGIQPEDIKAANRWLGNLGIAN